MTARPLWLGSVAFGVLVLACALILVGTKESSRPAKTFRAVAAADASPSPSEEPASQPQVAPHPMLDQTVHSILYDAMANDMNDEDASYLGEQLVEALALERVGTVAGRVRVARTEVAELLERLREEPKLEGELSPLQERAIEQEAKRWSRRIVARLAATKAKQKRSVDGYPKIDWRTLTGFAYEPGMTLPTEVTTMNDRRVAIDGYMIITSWGDERRVEQFLLTESMWGCCFAREPQIHEGIVVDAPGVEGREGPITVLGVLEVREQREDGEVVGIYHLRAHQVRSL